MNSLLKKNEDIDQIKGVTLEERARLVLAALGKSPPEIQKAYRRLAKRHHPDAPGGSTLKFKVINEAYNLLAKGIISGRPLLADDEVVMSVTGRRVEPLLDRQKDWEQYERWHRDRFYGVGVL
ncbi:MAG: J domain-containing protein [Kiritimatiellia bacterium]